MEEKYIIHPKVKIGHVHLKVADIERSLKFYRDLLGFEVMTWYQGDKAVFLSAGGYHHHIALNTFYSKGATPPPAGHTGLYHVAILFPNRAELAKVVKRLVDADWPILGVEDHGISEAVYLADPDENGVELYVDRPADQWPRTQAGKVNAALFSKPITVEDILASLEQ